MYSVRNRGALKSLDKRTMGIGVCCETCKFCKKYFIYGDGQDTCIHLCFVDGDPSPEDDEYLLEVMQGAGNPEFVRKCTKEFRNLILLPKKAERIQECLRFVRIHDMCNHYLPYYMGPKEEAK